MMMMVMMIMIHGDDYGNDDDHGHLVSMVVPVWAATGFARSSSTLVGNPWVVKIYDLIKVFEQSCALPHLH